MGETVGELLRHQLDAYKEVGAAVATLEGTVAENTRVCRETQAKLFDKVAELATKVDTLSTAIESDKESREKAEIEKRNDAKAIAQWFGGMFQKYWLPLLVGGGLAGSGLGGWHITREEPATVEDASTVESSPIEESEP